MKYSIKTSLGLAAVTFLAATSVANAGCLITAQNNSERDLPLGTCLYMSDAYDYDHSVNIATNSVCEGFNPIHDESWNNTIVKIGATGPATVSLLMDNRITDNSMTVTFQDAGEYVLPDQFSSDATVVWCY